MNDFVRPTSMEVPEGGLASFLTATVGDWADTPKEVPLSGIGGVKSVADKLAEYGRHEDTYMIHAAEGETVIPMAVFDENPRLKESLFKQMRAMGVDPDRYVVGSELNSINPVTGQPEFFLKKLFKGLKKAVKAVVKVIKKVAPIALSIGLNFIPGVGPILAATLGSGIGTLAQGGSFKDALKMAAIGGLSAGLFKGVSGGLKGMKAGTGFSEGFRSGVSSGLPGTTAAVPTSSLGTQVPTDPFTADLTGAQTAIQPPTLTGQDFIDTFAAPPQVPTPAGITDYVDPFTADLTGAQTAINTGAAPPQTSTLTGQDFVDTFTKKPPLKTVTSPLAGDINTDSLRMSQGLETDVADLTSVRDAGTPVSNAAAPDFLSSNTAVEQLRPPGIGESFKSIFTGEDKFGAAKDLFMPSSVTAQEVVAQQLGALPNASTQVLEELAKNAGTSYDVLLGQANKTLSEQLAGFQPTLSRRLIPGIAAGAGILALTDGFETPEMEEAVDPYGLGGKTGFDLMEQDPNRYRMFAQGAPYLVPKVGTAASGGTIDHFPRQNGSIAGPGTGTSDDIPAMLSDGEFVMTAQAVRGAGNGNRRQGVKRMYDIMRSYEGAA